MSTGARLQELFRSARFAWFLASCFAAVASPDIAFGHSVGVSRGDFTLEGDALEAELAFARTELLGSFPAIDSDQDGHLDEKELASARELFDQKIIQTLHVTASGTGTATCAGKLETLALTEEDGVVLHAKYACPKMPEALLLKLDFVRALSHGHRHLATLSAGSAIATAVAYGDNTALQLEVPKDAASAGGAREQSGWSIFSSLLVLGVEHILTGYDHLVFLFGLILVGGRVRSLMVVITAFTLAHSITLGLSALDVYSPSPDFVEPAIALSIAYVGVENFFVKDATKRWMITFPFGLIHGFGFAGALREISLPHSQVPVALAAFNLGVELGQLGVLTIVLPLVLWLRKRAWFKERGIKVLSALIVAAGLYWFIVRVT